MFGLRRNKTRDRGGITLIELLVVITILAMVAAVAIPRMRPMMENRHVRESARGLNVFLSQARIRAIETGRPCGVLFQRANDLGQPNACTEMRQVEIPPPYGGNTLNTRLALQLVSFSGGVAQVRAQLASGSFANDLIRVGDRVQINYQGPWYEITNASNVSNGYVRLVVPPPTPPPPATPPVPDTILLTADVGSQGAVPWPTGTLSDPMPFLIFRQPAFDASTGLTSAFGSVSPSLQLPQGTVVDLRYSGDTAAGLLPDPTNLNIYADRFRAETTTDRSAVVVMFSPSGGLDRIYFQDGNIPVTSSVYLLMGRWERMLDPLPDDGFTNWQDMTNFWIAVSPQTGLVTVAEPGNVPNSVPDDEKPSYSRHLVREAQISKGGR